MIQRKKKNCDHIEVIDIKVEKVKKKKEKEKGVGIFPKKKDVGGNLKNIKKF